MKDKKLLKELDEIRGDWYKNKSTVDTKLLIDIFKIDGGHIFTNIKEKIAVGILPFPGMLGMYFFQITEDDRFKYVEERGIVIDEESEAVLSFAIKLCKLEQDIDDKGSDNDYIQ